ncbi:spindle and kinetochore-associated protein 3 isoform X1 [Syngnathus acus]|uniref:spindle and kinetochore-associated protein 3 isoform X1 n=1 Tax=Syngnathus acus TaxID=161584 RepID=UPI00188626AD|nr:spindle and kinetochore-associated protein 3 isoform X1 [Syngnathus acus]
MDPDSEFFAKLKKMCRTLETETARLQKTFENRHDSPDSEAAAKAMRAYHDFNCEVLGLKGQLQDELRKHNARKINVDTFIHACRAVQSNIAHDVCALTEHFENYGYQAPTDARVPNESGENEPEKDDGEDDVEAEECSGPLMSPQAAAPPSHDGPMRTPKLSDFGLCKLDLRRTFFKSAESPTMPELSLPCLDVSALPPPMPTCMLRVDEDELRMPQMEDFGFSEITMDLFKKMSDDISPAQDLVKPPVPTVCESVQEVESLKIPEPPAFSTLEFKIPKTNGCCSASPPRFVFDAQSPSGAVHLPDTPEVPVFKTPAFKRLLGSKKLEPTVAKRLDSIAFLETPRSASVLDRKAWEYDMPELQIPGMQECADLDGVTEDFHLSPPRATRDSYEISTPEFPHLSSVTQDICKLVLESQKPLRKPQHNRRCVNAVSEQEFQSLPAFLKQITLNDLNQAVHHINEYLVQCPGEDTREFRMEELKRITKMGIKAPVYMLCLSELRRLQHVEGARNNTIYTLNLCS